VTPGVVIPAIIDSKLLLERSNLLGVPMAQIYTRSRASGELRLKMTRLYFVQLLCVGESLLPRSRTALRIRRGAGDFATFLPQVRYLVGE